MNIMLDVDLRLIDNVHLVYMTISTYQKFIGHFLNALEATRDSGANSAEFVGYLFFSFAGVYHPEILL